MGNVDYNNRELDLNPNIPFDEAEGGENNDLSNSSGEAVPDEMGDEPASSVN